jgi:hypothetical protein
MRCTLAASLVAIAVAQTPAQPSWCVSMNSFCDVFLLVVFTWHRRIVANAIDVLLCRPKDFYANITTTDIRYVRFFPLVDNFALDPVFLALPFCRKCSQNHSQAFFQKYSFTNNAVQNDYTDYHHHVE